MWEGQLSLPLSNLIRHLTLRIIYSGFTMKPARQESNSVLSTMLYRNGHWPLVHLTAIPNLTQIRDTIIFDLKVRIQKHLSVARTQMS